MVLIDSDLIYQRSGASSIIIIYFRTARTDPRQVHPWFKHDAVIVKTCWIAHAKEVCGLKPRTGSLNRTKLTYWKSMK